MSNFLRYLGFSCWVFAPFTFLAAVINAFNNHAPAAWICFWLTPFMICAGILFDAIDRRYHGTHVLPTRANDLSGFLE